MKFISQNIKILQDLQKIVYQNLKQIVQDIVENSSLGEILAIPSIPSSLEITITASTNSTL